RKSAAPPMSFIERAGGICEIGAKADDDASHGSFCFDNETPRHRVLLNDHAIANRLVTNGEFREFIRDGGYTQPALWLADGWTKIRADGWYRPLCWSDDLEREFT